MLQLKKRPENADNAASQKRANKLKENKQKALAKKQKLLEQKQSILQDYLLREIKYGLYTFKKHQMTWRKMLTDSALPKQRQDLEFAWQKFEHVIDIKDFIISRLMDELHQTENQYMNNLNKHAYSIDKLIAVFHGKLEEIHENYEMQILFLKEKEQECMKISNTNTDQNEISLKTIRYALEVRDKERERNLRSDICSKMELAISNHESDMLGLKGRLENAFERMWKKTNDVLNSFRKKNRERVKECDILISANDKALEIVSSEQKRLYRLSKIIGKLKKKDDELSYSNKLINLKAEMKFFRECFLVLKQKLAADLKIDKRKQEFLIAEFYGVCLQLKHKLQLGENLVKLIRSSKKMETSEEKVRPYPSRAYYKGENVKERHNLFHFWQRIAKVDASRNYFSDLR
ncbi:hypothetical protein HHI36_013477 [Cryptolaemus montrouzieri]|uniref:Dynein regulatory complex subunit 2 n=1 Tax=Cryptolaemus montrouzieri TaxID=559131 RepID=A0ABD2NHW4_9CUCU